MYLCAETETETETRDDNVDRVIAVQAHGTVDVDVYPLHVLCRCRVTIHVTHVVRVIHLIVPTCPCRPSCRRKDVSYYSTPADSFDARCVAVFEFLVVVNLFYVTVKSRSNYCEALTLRSLEDPVFPGTRWLDVQDRFLTARRELMRKER